MTRILVLLAAAFFSGATHSDKYEFCEVLGGYAEVVMSNHQSGVPLSSMIAILTKNRDDGTLPENQFSLLEAIVVDAYDQPRFSTDKHQQSTVREFTDAVVLQCLKVNQ